MRDFDITVECVPHINWIEPPITEAERRLRVAAEQRITRALFSLQSKIEDRIGLFLNHNDIPHDPDKFAEMIRDLL